MLLNNLVFDCAIVLNTPSNIRNIDEKFIIAADGGYDHVIKQNKKPNILIGDFDSCKQNDCDNVLKLNPIKNDTDGQKALEYATEKGFKNIAIYGASEGRLDHVMCNLSLLAKAKKNNITAVVKDINCTIYYLEEGAYSLNIDKGCEFSLIASPQALVANSSGMQYSFDKLLLEKENLGRGVSNKAILETISFEVLTGALFLVINN